MGGRPPRGGVDWNLLRTRFWRSCQVAPLAGAWIGTFEGSAKTVSGVSPPSRGRGLELPSKKMFGQA